MVQLDIALETTRTKVKFAGYDLEKNRKEKMKTRLLIILGIIILVTVSISVLGILMNSDPKPKPLLCGKDFIQRGDECHPDPRLLESNTVLIYSVTDNDNTRIATAPHDITIDLEKNDTVTWINKSFFTATVYDREGMWSTGEFKPSTQKSIQFNNTGLYDYLVDANDRHHGEIVALSDETNSLPIELRMKMGMSMVSGNIDNDPALIGVGIGATVDGVQITINQEELKKYVDAESHYYDMYKTLIPFDVPITIDFAEPMRALTG